MSKVLVDRELLEDIEMTWRVPHRDAGCFNELGRRKIEEGLSKVRAILAKPKHPEGFEIARHSKRLVEQLRAELSAVTAERDRLLQFEAAYNEWHDKTEWVQKTAKAHELGKHRADALKDRIDQLRAEIEGMRGMLDAALYYVPEHKHDLRELISAAMAAKEA